MRKSIHSESEMVKAVKELESGVNAEVVAREHGISKATLYQWKSKYSGMDVSQVRECERITQGLKTVVFFFTVDLCEVESGSIDWIIYDPELPDPVKGTLHVIVE